MPKGSHTETPQSAATERRERSAQINSHLDEGATNDAAAFAAEVARKGGLMRAARLTPERRSEIAQKAAATRWAKKA